jgi:uncharacterized RDD family membrane protein YckC
MREHNYLPADFNDRIHAFSIDYGLVVLVMLIAIFMQFSDQYDPIIKITITLIAWYFLNVFPNHIKKGSTLGKKNSDIIVLTSEYKEVNLLTMYMRETFILVMSLFTAGLYVVISFALLESRIDKRALHDLLFNTRVVKKTPFVGKG